MKSNLFSLFLLSFTFIFNSCIFTSWAKPIMCLEGDNPVGNPVGIFPGRVCWSHDPEVVKAAEFSDTWMSDSSISLDRCETMLRSVLCDLTGTDDEKQAWQHLIAFHNNGKPYAEGEKIAIKINNNNTYSHSDSPEINATPQMVLALLRSLINIGGFAQDCITIAEPSRFITDNMFVLCHKEFPGVHYVDNQGGDGREKSEFVDNVMHYSADNGMLARGIAKCFCDADYTINLALLKGHVGQGVTLCAKNWYGAMNLHADWRKNYHNNFDPDRSGKFKYMTFVDFMGHKDLGGKCILYLIDGLVGCKYVDGKPGPKWNNPPFSTHWPASLLASQDPVAIDMVGLDLLSHEFPDAPDMGYADMYLIEAAAAGNPPSATYYNPDGDSEPLTSLGVAEHCHAIDSIAPYLHYKSIDLRYLPNQTGTRDASR